jgi:hypothetical protein
LFGLLRRRLDQRIAAIVSAVIVAVFAGITIGVYEYVAFRAARTLSRDDRPIASSVAGGAAFSVAIWAGYALAYLLLEFGRTP